MGKLSDGYVLICHVQKDRNYAGYLARQLKGRLIRARVDEGAELEQLIRRARQADALLVVMTPDAHDSEALSKQIEVARNLRTPLFAVAVDDSDPMVELGDDPLWPVTRHRPLSDEQISALAEAVGVRPRPARRQLGIPAVAAIVAAAVVLAVVITAAVTRYGKATAGPGGVVTSTAAATTAASTVPPDGRVTITSPTDGAVVKRCERVSGSASLPTDQTIMYGVIRVSPPDKTWYYNYVGSYDEGFVPSTWAGDVYFGMGTNQKWDLVIYVMTVKVARAFWNAHKSGDGSFGFGTDTPKGARVAARIRVTQGSLGAC